METKNTILARQKEMQLSLEKVKHLIRLIQAFNFNQTLAETEGKDVNSRVQNRAEGVVCSEPAPDSNSVEQMKDGNASVSSSSSSTDGNNQEEQHRATGINEKTQPAAAPAAAAGDTGGPAVVEDGPDLAADDSLGLAAGDTAESGVKAEGGAITGTEPQAETVAQPETEAPPVGEAPAASAVATTNGTTEPACPAHSPAGGCTTDSDNRMAAVNSPETATEKKQEEITDSDGSNNSNSKTSEPCQHSLPALVSSLDNKK